MHFKTQFFFNLPVFNYFSNSQLSILTIEESMDRQSPLLFTAVSNTGFANTISYNIFFVMNIGIDKSLRSIEK